MSQPLAPRGGNDRVYTPPPLARAIVNHFKPEGFVVEPCAGPVGKQPFVDAMTDCNLAWYEIDEGSDFLTSDNCVRFDWAVTNPPWSKLREFLKKSMSISDNVVFLCLVNAFFMKARIRDMKEAGFGIREILFVPTPPKPWPQTGFALGAVHVQREYDGLVAMTHLQDESLREEEFWG